MLLNRMVAPAYRKYNYGRTPKRASAKLHHEWNFVYFCVGFAGLGAGAAGGVFAGADFSPCRTERGPPCLMALMESVTDVNMNSTAEMVVALESAVAAPRGPNAAWLPCPPKAAEMSPALPLCKRTTIIRNRHTMTCMMVTRMIMESRSPKLSGCERLGDIFPTSDSLTSAPPIGQGARRGIAVQRCGFRPEKADEPSRF